MLNKIFWGASLSLVALYGDCVVFSCDATIRYAIGRYSDKTVLRLNDYKRTIAASQKSEEVYAKVIDEQNLELAKLLERSVIENMDMKAIIAETKRARSLQ